MSGPPPRFFFSPLRLCVSYAPVAERPWSCYNSSIAKVAPIARSNLLILFVILIIVLMSLIVVLWGGTIFIQGYVFTEPAPGIAWRAPVLAAVLTLGYAIWCLSVALSSDASTTNIPINTIFRFTPKEDMLRRPAANLWAIKADRNKTGDKAGETILYKSRHVPGKLNQEKFQYFDPDAKLPWQSDKVVAIEIQPEGEPARMRFDLLELQSGRLDLVDTKRGQYRQFVSSDGWVITEYEEGPSGLPVRFLWSRFLLNVFFNAAHFGAWFLGLWFLLRYQWLHALGLAAVMWLVMTLVILPMLLGYAGQVSEARRSVTAAGLPTSFPRSAWERGCALPRFPILRDWQSFPRLA